MNIKNKKYHFTIEIFKSNKKEYKKLTQFIKYINHLRNCFYIIAHEEHNVFNKCYITSNQYDIAKLSTTLDYKLSDKTTNLISHIRNIKSIVGGVYTENIAHLVARDIKSIISLRSKQIYSNLPLPRKFEKLNKFTFSVSQYSCKIFQKKKSKQIRITLGSQFSKFKKYITFRLPNHLLNLKYAKELKITWLKDIGFKLSITYEIENKNQYNLDKNNFISIDLGHNNIISSISNKLNSFLISGKPLQSFDHWFQNKVAYLNSNNKSILKIHHYAKSIRKLTFSTIANKLITLCINNNIGTIYIGKLNTIFQNKSKNHKTNKSFRYWKFGYLLNKLKYLAKYFSIQIVEVDEYFTSQFSCLSDQIETDQKSTSKTKRYKGIFRDRKSKLSYHADLNGAWNIALKQINNLRDWMNNNFKFVKKSLCNPIKIKHYIPTNPHGLNQLLDRVKPDN